MEGFFYGAHRWVHGVALAPLLGGGALLGVVVGDEGGEQGAELGQGAQGVTPGEGEGEGGQFDGRVISVK